MQFLQFPQAAHQRVIFGVSDFRLVEDIVQVLVAAQRAPQLRDLHGGIFHGHLNYNLTRNPEKTPSPNSGTPSSFTIQIRAKSGEAATCCCGPPSDRKSAV